MNTRQITCALILTGMLASSLDAALVWRPGEGWSTEGSGGETLAASDARQALEIARGAEAREDWKSARDSYRAIVRRWPLSSAASEAQFKVALMNERMGEFMPAFKAYQEVVRKHAGSQFFELAIERIYSVGNLYLAGEPQRIWKIPLFPSMDRTAEIFEYVIEAAPYGPLAPAAQFKIGLAREKQRNWSAAISAYNRLLDRYPASDFADDAQYQIGFAWYQASSEPDYDQSAAQKSVEAFQDFLVRFPNSEKAGQAQDYIAELNERRAQGSFNIARFYERQRNYRAAIIYYSEVIQMNPESEQAREARGRVETLRAKVQDQNANIESSSFSPALGLAKA